MEDNTEKLVVPEENAEKPVVPDGWLEFEYSDPDPDAVAEEVNRLKQGWHKLHAPVDKGVDERGPYDVIPLAMVRGGEATPHTVHTKPMKHLILDQTIPPRGWYKSKIEADRVRPRPCLLPDAKVNTPYGYKEIQHIMPGDSVFGYDEIDGKVVEAVVQNVTSQTKQEYMVMELDNGLTLRLTPEHLVFTKELGWLEARALTKEHSLIHVDGYSIAKLEFVDYITEETLVYDIQTDTHNFFAEDVLVHNCYSEALLTSPFLGFCPVGCSFCYINNGSRGYRATGLPTVDPDYPEKYREQLKKVMVAGAGYMTSFSEAFHKLEDTYHVTERLTKVFVEEGLPIFYCTRRLPTEWAIDALQVSPYSYMQFSINTSVHDDYRKLSPGAAKLSDMFAMIQRLRILGVYTSIQCNPIHPGITTLTDLKELVKLLAGVGNNHIIFKFCEQVANARKVIVDRLYDRKFDPRKVDMFDRLFNQVIGGVYTIQQDVRIAWLEELLATTRQYGMTMSLCYEYYENGDAGTNLAPYFTTSDQCHGRGIPIHYRPALGEKFVPLPGCYRKGCLYCAEYGTKSCRNEQLQQALALEYGIANKIQLVGNDEDWNLPESCARPEDEASSDNRNPGLMTDAELWGWIPQYTNAEVGTIAKLVPSIPQHSGSRQLVSEDEWRTIS